MSKAKQLVRAPGVVTTQLTVLGTMRLAFPRGYVNHAYYRGRLDAMAAERAFRGKPETEFRTPPATAVDLFAVAGLLLLRSGAYHHVVSSDPTSAAPRTIVISDADRARWVAAGAEWRGDVLKELPPAPKALLDAWALLLKHKDDPVFRSGDNWTTCEPWWRAAVELYAIADEAARDIGFDSERPKSAQSRYVEAAFRENVRTRAGAGKKTYSFSRADRDHLCVLPKSRTPGVGCTIRSLSHHLALLPPRSLARAHWTFSSSFDQDTANGPFNVVVLPLPFGIRASAFKGRPVGDGDWGWFDVDPHWCPASQDGAQIPPGFDKFTEFIKSVLKKAAEDVGEIHALILPEVALSSQVFRLLAEDLKVAEGSEKLELLVSGLFDLYDGRDGTIRKGNFTGMARFVRFGQGDPSPTLNISIREKHHRWKVDAGQIEAYALGSSLDVNRKWWEGIDILSRSLDVFVLRGNSTITTLICEDLARNDPCQELVRGIGPNFVVALLMDGPQRSDRWPARYGTVLADDPGSSVLTLTSYGLMRRSNDTGQFPAANQIGLFRDDTGKATELKLPTGAQGICITLQPSRLKEYSMDGRHDDGDAQSWRLSAVVPVKVGEVDAAIMAGDWPVPLP